MTEVCPPAIRSAKYLATSLLRVLLCATLLLGLSSCSDAAREDTVAPAIAPAPPLSADGVLERAIEFHDPGGVWTSGRFELEIEESRPDGTVRTTTVELDNGRGAYRIRSDFGDAVAETEVHGETLVSATLDGRTDFSKEDAERYRLTEDRALRMRNYYLYLWGLPMKLRDPGAVLDDEVTTTTYQGREALELRVSYDPEVGSDVWYFYFDPATGELFGYRFYHDESAGDGEYIVLEELAEVNGLRLPARRTWYTHQEDRLLGTDTLVGKGAH